jgi:hypothetical protein
MNSGDRYVPIAGSTSQPPILSYRPSSVRREGSIATIEAPAASAFRLTHGASHVALKLQAVLTKLDSEKSIEEALDVDDIRRLTTELSDAIKPSAPVKKVGALRRGRKLTRTGLLYRYQSFLMKELQTLSLNLYGDRDCALEYIAEDDAVNLRCSGRPKYPFFDESRLADRARSVLKSLKIDTKQFDILGRHGVTWATSESWPSHSKISCKSLL